MTAPDLRSIALIVLLALLWGGAYPLLKVAVESVPPTTVAACRAAVGGLMLLVLLGPRRAELLTLVRTRPGLWVQALCNCIITWLLISWAALVLESSILTILNSLSPLFIFLITWAITRHEHATPRKLMGVVLGLAGVVAIIGVDALAGIGSRTVAELACVGGSIAYAIAGIAGTRYRTHPLLPAAGSLLLASLVLVPLAIAVDGIPAHTTVRSLVALAVLCVLSTGAAFVVYFRLLNTVGSIATSAQGYLRVLIGVGLGVAFLDDPFGWSQGLGLALVMAGVVAMTTGPARK